MLKLLFLSLPLLWCGMVMSISFMEAPLKFRAPGITPALGSGIGRLVFRTLNRIECAAFVGWLLLLFSVAKDISYLWTMIPVGTVLLLQTSWLLPLLAARVTMVNKGRTPPRDLNHVYYIGGEVIKCTLLLVTAFTQLSGFVR